MKHALVVDDNAANRKLAVAMLKKLGWTAKEAENGFVALEKLQEEAFSLVLLDITMPGMCGDEVCQKIRAQEQFSRLPVFAYTATADASNRDEMLSWGFDDILPKPINMALLADKVACLVASA